LNTFTRVFYIIDHEVYLNLLYIKLSLLVLNHDF